ncbi:MAG: sigma-70 family RNA polymerase sigma factor [Planctomycetota bacterium]
MTPLTPEQHFVRYRDAGDVTALAAVFDALAGELLLVAGHLVRDGATAEDLVQTTFVEAMRCAKRYDARRPLLPWLATILSNHARKLHRRLRRDAQGPPNAGRDERSAAEHAFDRETMAAIESGLLRLRAPYREVLTLRLVHELSPAAIAHAIGCPPETVKTRLKRGLELLRRGLPTGLTTSLALLLVSGRGLSALRTDVMVQARKLATRSVASGPFTAVVLGGILMKQLLWATLVLVALLLGWWRVDELGAAAMRPGAVDAPRSVATSEWASAGADAVASSEREVLSSTPAPVTSIVFVGRCVAADTGAPLAGVEAVAFLEWPWPARTVCDNELSAETPAGRTASAKDGTFELHCERHATAAFSVRVGNREHLHRMRSFGPYAQDQVIQLGDVSLARGVHVSLSVVDRRGAPAAGVRITASAHHVTGRNAMLMQKSGYPWRSDAQGEIHLPYSMPPGNYDFVWWDDDLPVDRVHGVIQVPPGPAEHHVMLVWPVEDARQSIVGDVLDEHGRPVPWLSLGALGAGTRGNARTRHDGTFRMVRIEPYDDNALGPVGFGLPNPTCGVELVVQPTCQWGDREVHLIVRPAATLVVRAVDGTTGAAVTDVHVACAAHLDGAEAPTIVWPSNSPLEHHADGSVSRRLPRCEHDVQVFPKDPRLAPSFKVAWHARDGEELLVSLRRLRECTVRVVTSDGKPVAGTELWTLQPIECAAGAPAATGWQEVTVPVAEEQLLEPSTRWGRHGIDDAPLGRARTGADGRARILVPPDADVVIAALGPGHVPKAIVGRAAEDGEIELLVVRGAVIRLVLTPKEVAQRLARSPLQRRMPASGMTDNGCGGVAFQIVRTDAEQDPARPQAAAVVDLEPDGTCEVRGLTTGRYDMVLGGYIESEPLDGINAFWQFGSVSLDEGEVKELALDVSRWAIGRLQGQVLLNGQPWAHGAGNLSCLRLRESGTVMDSRTDIPVVTDAQGRFDVEATAGDSFQLVLLGLPNGAPGGCCVAGETARVQAGRTTSVVFAVRDVKARVRIVDDNDEPAAGLTVTTDFVTSPAANGSWVTDADGWITMHTAPQVPFQLIVANPNGPLRAGRRSPGSGDAMLGPFQIPPDGDRAEFRAKLPTGWR